MENIQGFNQRHKIEIKKAFKFKSKNLIGQKVITEVHLYLVDDSEEVILFERKRIRPIGGDSNPNEILTRKFWFGDLMLERMSFRVNTLLSMLHKMITQ